MNRNKFPAQRTDPLYPYFPPCVRNYAEPGTLSDGKLPELHLYHGSHCNRSCSFCCVGGSPRGWHKAFSEEVMDLALALVSPRGMLKFYGGEPTLYPEEIKAAICYFNQRGFIGEYRIYSNGVEAEALLDLLEFEPRMHCLLNYSILHGRQAKPIPRQSLARLLDARSERIFAAHQEIEDTGDPHKTPVLRADIPRHQKCWNCFPALRSDGVMHACPFAVETLDERFNLGSLESQADPDLMIQRFDAALRWQREVVDAEAERRGITACEVCRHHLKSLPSPFKSIAHEERK